MIQRISDDRFIIDLGGGGKQHHVSFGDREVFTNII